MVTPESPSLRDLAYQSVADSRLEEALGQLRSWLQVAGPDMTLCNDMAVVAFRLGRTEEAVTYFREAQRLRAEADTLLADNLLDALQSAAVAAPVAPQPSEADRFSQWLASSAAALHSDARKLSDEQWLDALCRSVDGQPFNEHLLPAFIDEEMQRTYVGSSGVGALHEAHRFMSVMATQWDKHGLALSDESVAVDFGSGWGRYTRFMLKHVHPDNLYGFEVNSSMVEHCRKAFGMANFLKVGSMPPSPLRSGMVDLVFGYSVFSHLAPHCADAWIAEFARITRPGGLVLMTTQGRSFIDFCEGIRRSGDCSNAWFLSLANSFINTEQCLKDYDSGQFLHAGHGQYGGTYGESLIPRAYIERTWSKDFELVDFIDDRSILPQALFVLKRRALAG